MNMAASIYKTEKIKSGRPRCPARATAIDEGHPRYFDARGTERFTASGNAVAGKREWDTKRRRALGMQPPEPKRPAEETAAYNRFNVKRWRKENPEKLRVQRNKNNFIRRSAVRGRTIEKITVEFLKEQRELQNDCCAYCVASLSGGGHQDHVIPVSKGGAHAPHNIVWACEPCNLRKGAKLGWKPFWK